MTPSSLAPVPQNLQNVNQNTAPLDAAGNFVRIWYMFFQSIMTAVNYLLDLDIDARIVALVNGKEPIILQKTQSQLAALASSLTAKQKGQLVEVTDYAHLLEWSGTAFIWAPGDAESDWFVFTGGSTRGTGWHACDGSTVSYLKPDGTLGSRVLPNTAGSAAYAKAASAYSAAITSAAVPTISAPTISTPSITVNNATLGTTGFTAGGVPAVTQTSHNHSATSSTPTATVPVATLTGDPIPNFSAVLYYRQ